MDRVPATAESGKRDLLDLGMLEDPVLDKKGLAGEHRRIRKRFTQNERRIYHIICVQVGAFTLSGHELSWAGWRGFWLSREP